MSFLKFFCLFFFIKQNSVLPSLTAFASFILFCALPFWFCLGVLLGVHLLISFLLLYNCLYFNQVGLGNLLHFLSFLHTRTVCVFKKVPTLLNFSFPQRYIKTSWEGRLNLLNYSSLKPTVFILLLFFLPFVRTLTHVIVTLTQVTFHVYILYVFHLSVKSIWFLNSFLYVFIFYIFLLYISVHAQKIQNLNMC